MVGCGTNIPDKTQHPARSVTPLTYEEHYGFIIDDDTANTSEVLPVHHINLGRVVTAHVSLVPGNKKQWPK
jgi:hypothetical protein